MKRVQTYLGVEKKADAVEKAQELVLRNLAVGRAHERTEQGKGELQDRYGRLAK